MSEQCAVTLLTLADDPMKFCRDCLDVDPPMWRKKNRCNKCSLNYEKKHYCRFCDRSYRKTLDKLLLTKCVCCKGAEVHTTCAPKGPYACPACAPSMWTTINLGELAYFACE